MFSHSLRRVQPVASITSEAKKLMLGFRLLFFGAVLCIINFSVPVYNTKFDFFNDIPGVLLIGAGVSQLAAFRVSQSYATMLTFVKAVVFLALFKTVWQQFSSVYDTTFPYTLFEFVNLSQFVGIVVFGLAMLHLCSALGLYAAQKSWLVAFTVSLFLYGVPFLTNFVLTVWVVGGKRFGIINFSASNLGFFEFLTIGLILLISAVPLFFMHLAVKRTRQELVEAGNNSATHRLADFWYSRTSFKPLQRWLLSSLGLASLALLTGLPTLLSSAAMETVVNVVVDPENESGVAVDKTTGDILVVGNFAIKRYTSAGRFKQEIPFTGDYPMFKTLTTDKQGFIYVTSIMHATVFKYKNDGELASNWRPDSRTNRKTLFSQAYDFNMPEGITTDSQGNVYVADLNHIRKYTSDGVLLLDFQQLNGATPSVFGQSPPETITFPNYKGLAVDKQGNVYAADPVNARIVKFNAEGRFVLAWGDRGEQRGQFKMVFDVAVDSKGLIYTADRHNHRIQVFDAQGNFVRMWGSFGENAGQFHQPQALAIDSSDNVYVLDIRGRLQKFQPK